MLGRNVVGSTETAQFRGVRSRAMYHAALAVLQNHRLCQH